MSSELFFRYTDGRAEQHNTRAIMVGAVDLGSAPRSQRHEAGNTNSSKNTSEHGEDHHLIGHLFVRREHW